MVFAFRGEPFAHTHENEVFDMLLEQLQAVWGESEEHYYLLGNVMCNGRELDALFLKRNALVIIDFKHYGGQIKFSQNNIWYADDQPVMGGNNLNPFRQMRENKYNGVFKFLEDLGELPSKRPQAFGHVAGLVLFHAKPIEFDERTVPRKIASWFKVTDLERAVTRLDQIGSQDINFSTLDLQAIAKALDAPEYVPVAAKLKQAAAPMNQVPIPEIRNGDEEFEVRDTKEVARVKTLPEITTPESRLHAVNTTNDQPFGAVWPARQAWRNEIAEFMDSEDDRILILSGTHGTEVQEAVGDIISQARGRKVLVKVLAPNRRLADSYVQHEASSVYSYIYGGNAHEKEGQLVYELAPNSDADDHVYVVVEAHLISDSHYETETFRFGSGRLLSDLLEYVDPKSTKRKLVFVGDRWQLTRGATDEAATSGDRLTALAELRVQHHETQAVAPNRVENPLVRNAQALVKALVEGRFNHFEIQDEAPLCVFAPASPTIRRAEIRDAFKSNPYGTKFVAYSNRDVTTFNDWIRRTAFARTGKMQPGDVMTVFNGFTVRDETGMEGNVLVPSGSFVEILEVQGSASIEQPLSGRSQPVRVDFVKVRALVLDSQREVEFNCLRDFIYSDKPAVQRDVMIALRANAERRLKERLAMVSLSSDPETARRQKDAFRATFMRLDPWLNAAQLRFGYGITLHRAQGSRFPTVFLNFETGQGQENGAYFRWVYTGFTIASRQLVMINVPKITLVSKAQWSVPANPSGEVMPKNSIAYNPNLNRVADPAFPNLALQNLFSYIVSSIKDNGIDVKLLGRHNYQEIYQFSKEPGHNCTVRMYYNSKYEVTRIDSLDSTPPEFFEQITDLLVAPRAPQEGFSAELYEYLAPVFQDSGLKIIGLEHHPFQDVYYIAKGRQRAAIQIFYDSDGFVTRVSPAAYTDAKIIPTIRTAMGV